MTADGSAQGRQSMTVAPASSGDSDHSLTAEAEISAAVVRCASGDRLALRIIYDREAARMIGVAMRILRRKDLAEEATHEAFLRIWRSAQSFDPARGAARAWLFAIVRNQALTILRNEQRFDADTLDENHEPDLDDRGIEVARDRARCVRCLQQLDTGRRSAIVLAYVHGFSHGELAGRLGVPLGTVKSWVRRGLRSLQECMG